MASIFTFTFSGFISRLRVFKFTQIFIKYSSKISLFQMASIFTFTFSGFISIESFQIYSNIPQIFLCPQWPAFLLLLLGINNFKATPQKHADNPRPKTNPPKVAKFCDFTISPPLSLSLSELMRLLNSFVNLRSKLLWPFIMVGVSLIMLSFETARFGILPFWRLSLNYLKISLRHNDYDE